jgi:phage gpG-like protein
VTKTLYEEDIAAELDEMARRFADEPLDEALAVCVPILREGFADNFGRQQGPTGAAWPDRKDRKPHPLLTETGRLWAAVTGSGAGSVERTIDGRELHVGVDETIQQGGIPGAAAHNFGFPPQNIPQREFLYASEDTLDRSAEEFVGVALTTIFVF